MDLESSNLSNYLLENFEVADIFGTSETVSNDIANFLNTGHGSRVHVSLFVLERVHS